MAYCLFDVSTSDALGNSYTHLLRHPEEPLSCRIEASLNEYLNVILEQSDQRFTDSAKAVSVLLNHTEIQEDLAKGYIQRLDTVLAMVTDIENRNLWPALFDNNTVRPTSSNILAYYKAFCNGKAQLDQHLVNMLQSNASKIIWLRSDVEEYIDDNEADCLYKKLIQCTNLPTDSYRTVLKAIADITYDAFEIRDLPDEYIAIVIDLGIIEINADNLDFVRRYYPEQVIRFLMQNNGSVTSKLIDQATIQLQSDELIGMLESGRLNRKVAMHILDNWNSTLSIAGVDCSPTVRVKVLTTCFDLDDINWFLVNYDIQTVTVQRAFLNLVQEYPKQFYAAAKPKALFPHRCMPVCYKYSFQISLYPCGNCFLISISILFVQQIKIQNSPKAKTPALFLNISEHKGGFLATSCVTESIKRSLFKRNHPWYDVISNKRAGHQNGLPFSLYEENRRQCR